MPATKLTSKWQITIPKEVWEKLRLEFLGEDGRFVVRKKLASSPFDCYVGYLQHKRGEDPDEIVKKLRRHS